MGGVGGARGTGDDGGESSCGDGGETGGAGGDEGNCGNCGARRTGGGVPTPDSGVRNSRNATRSSRWEISTPPPFM